VPYCLIHWIVPSHPIHLIFNVQHAGLTRACGLRQVRDSGGLRSQERQLLPLPAPPLFTVNFGNEGLPLDQWFGRWHDGSKEAQERMMARRAANRKNKMPNEGSVGPDPAGGT